MAIDPKDIKNIEEALLSYDIKLSRSDKVKLEYSQVRAILINYGGTIKVVEDKDCLEIWQDSASSGIYYRLDPSKGVIPVEDTLLFTPIYSIISISYKKV